MASPPVMGAGSGKASGTATRGYIGSSRWLAPYECGAPWRFHCAGVQHFMRTLCSLPSESSSATTSFTARCLAMADWPSNLVGVGDTRRFKLK